jgi:23S rRNA pseudouridine2605 synthase
MTTEEPKGQRIAKVIAHAGVCSRRDAEKLIDQGKVKVDGKTISTPATLVTSANEVIVNGEVISAPKEQKLWIFHKPKGVITSNKDPEGRDTVFDCLPRDMPRTITIGRLDYNTEGLLLLTNDGELARSFEHPSSNLQRKYRVRVNGEITQSKLDRMHRGLTIKDDVSNRHIRYGKIEASVEKSSGGKNTWMEMSIWEGKNREIRKICEHLNLSVNRLIRIKYGILELGSLPVGEVMEVPSSMLEKALKQLPQK